MLESNALFESWVEQAFSDDKVWFLIFKINNRGTFIVYDMELYDVFVHPKNNYVSYTLNEKNINVVIERMDEWFEDNKKTLLRYGVHHNAEADKET
mgnify:FL=1